MHTATPFAEICLSLAFDSLKAGPFETLCILLVYFAGYDIGATSGALESLKSAAVSGTDW